VITTKTEGKKKDRWGQQERRKKIKAGDELLPNQDIAQRPAGEGIRKKQRKLEHHSDS